MKRTKAELAKSKFGFKRAQIKVLEDMLKENDIDEENLYRLIDDSNCKEEFLAALSNYRRTEEDSIEPTCIRNSFLWKLSASTTFDPMDLFLFWEDYLKDWLENGDGNHIPIECFSIPKEEIEHVSNCIMNSTFFLFKNMHEKDRKMDELKELQKYYNSLGGDFVGITLNFEGKNIKGETVAQNVKLTKGIDYLWHNIQKLIDLYAGKENVEAELKRLSSIDLRASGRMILGRVFKILKNYTSEDDIKSLDAPKDEQLLCLFDFAQRMQFGPDPSKKINSAHEMKKYISERFRTDNNKVSDDYIIDYNIHSKSVISNKEFQDITLEDIAFLEELRNTPHNRIHKHSNPTVESGI